MANNNNVPIPSFKCTAVIESLSSTGSFISKTTINDCQICLARAVNNGDLILIVQSSKNCKRYTLAKNRSNTYRLNTRFVSEGKCSIFLSDYNVRVFLSNCPANDLSLFLKGLALKCQPTASKSSSPTILTKTPPNNALKRRIRTIQEVDKISPLTENDLINALAFRNRTNKSSVTSPLAPKNSAFPRKRKLDYILEQMSESSPNTRKKLLASAIPSPVRALKVLNSNTLTDDQRLVVESVLSRQNVFFTGSAGTGKSYLLKFLISRLPPASTFVTASTGIAACHINGITLHLFAGIPSSWMELEPTEICTRLRRNELKIQRWKNCRCLIIDEISMVSGDFFEMLDRVARLIRNKPNQPFGGIQIVVCGDFLQLPPISRNSKKKHHSFQTQAWKDAIRYCFQLQKVQRQTDESFISLLQSIRIGKMTDEVRHALIRTTGNDLRKNNSVPTQLFSLRKDVDAVNASQLSKLPTKTHVFTADDSNASYSEILDSLCPTPRRLELKQGAQVMLNRNIDLSRGLVNGLAGIVIRFESETNSSQQLPRVRFINGIEMIIKQERWMFRLQENHSVCRRHLPLQLAWALSVHKSQGMTITNGVEISLDKIFESGQAYVALSRSTSLDQIKILNFNLDNIIVDNEAIDFYRRLKYVP